ncbi:MAG: hypothetical protein LBQ66_02695 [Planctomycetaceae bacterium]|nr:hypothetical protein [Planctomycetaceae bacterium]
MPICKPPPLSASTPTLFTKKAWQSVAHLTQSHNVIFMTAGSITVDFGLLSYWFIGLS